MSKTFADILFLGRYFNLSKLDDIFINVQFNEESWKHESSMRNISFQARQCLLIKNYTKEHSEKYINISNEMDSTIFTNYLLAKMVRSSCEKFKPALGRRLSILEVWIYGFLSITLNNVLAVFGIFFLPLIKKKIYNSFMTFMVSLAIGALAGTSILILIPDSMQISEIVVKANFNKNDYKWKATVVFFGLYLFFLTERLLKSITVTNKHCSIMKFERNKLTNGEFTTDNYGISLNSLRDGIMVNSDNCKAVNLKKSEIVLFEKKADQLKENVETKQVIAPVAWMIIFGDSLHKFVDGLSISAAFSQSMMLGVSISIAELCEELPRELGDFAVLLTAGMSIKQAIFWNLMSALTCYAGFIIGAILGEVSSASVWIFAIAGGMFLYISLVDMMNNIINTIDDMVAPWKQKAVTFGLQNFGLWTGYAAIFILSLYSEQIRFDI